MYTVPVETPVGIRKLSDPWSEGSDFSSFREEKANMKRMGCLENEEEEEKRRQKGRRGEGYEEEDY